MADDRLAARRDVLLADVEVALALEADYVLIVGCDNGACNRYLSLLAWNGSAFDAVRTFDKSPTMMVAPEGTHLFVQCYSCGPSGEPGVTVYRNNSDSGANSIATFDFSKSQFIPCADYNCLPDLFDTLADQIFTCHNNACVILSVDTQSYAWYVADAQGLFAMTSLLTVPQWITGGAEHQVAYASVSWDANGTRCPLVAAEVYEYESQKRYEVIWNPAQRREGSNLFCNFSQWTAQVLNSTLRGMDMSVPTWISPSAPAMHSFVTLFAPLDGLSLLNATPVCVSDIVVDFANGSITGSSARQCWYIPSRAGLVPLDGSSRYAEVVQGLSATQRSRKASVMSVLQIAFPSNTYAAYATSYVYMDAPAVDRRSSSFDTSTEALLGTGVAFIALSLLAALVYRRSKWSSGRTLDESSPLTQPASRVSEWAGTSSVRVQGGYGSTL